MEAIRTDWGWGGLPGSGPIQHDLMWTLDTDVMQSLEPKGWLDDRIIYAYMWLLRDREEVIAAAGVYPRKPLYYFMEPLFMELAKKVDYSHPYFAKTMHFFLTWVSYGVGPPINQLDYIFVPANVNQNHWTPMVFFVKEWGVMVLDPMNYNAKYPEEEECWSCCRYMLHYVGKNKNVPDEEPLFHVWDAMPKQDNYSDCGVYVCKYMNYTLQGYDLAKVRWDASDVEIFRYRIAMEFQRGMAKPIPTHHMRQMMERVAGKNSS
ncbi:ubiquitin-like-specific protease ESD4 [Apium graveolens]|uniref:ubiquitin-like-specific protease ESD4 n=1 Tax=Apium graveolens TaxID=4045 RepID=UPI003D78FB9B